MGDQNLPTPGKFVSDALVQLFQERITQLIADLGRDVVLTMIPQENDCPNCKFDVINQRSSNIYTSNASGASLNKPFADGQRCPVCQGKGKLFFRRTITHKALIGFTPPPEEYIKEKNGLIPTDVKRTKTKLITFNDFEEAQYAEIDGVEYEKLTPPRKTGLRDLAFVLTYWQRRNS